ncbi:MAG: dihydrofolate reductase family protein [Bacteroidota bacterium]
MNSERKVIVYIATSLDGYIAGPNDDLTFLNTVEQEGEDYGYKEFIADIDTIIIGRRTYDKVLAMVPEYLHPDKDVYVITRTPKPGIGKLKFYTDNLQQLVKELKQQQGKNIFVDGGAQIINELLKSKLIDEFYISVIPVLLGKGIPLFDNNGPEQYLKLNSSKQFDKGLVQLHYTVQ